MELDWQKSSFSAASNCVEVAHWQKSRASNPSGNSVEVGEAGADVLVLRESDNPDEHVHTTREKFAAFIEGVKNGEYDHFAE